MNSSLESLSFGFLLELGKYPTLEIVCNLVSGRKGNFYTLKPCIDKTLQMENFHASVPLCLPPSAKILNRKIQDV